MVRRLAAVVGVAFLVVSGAAAEAQAFDASQRKDVEEIVRSYLRDHPEVILEAIEALQARNQADSEERAGKAIAANRSMLMSDPESPVTGNPKGDVTLVEFFDYNCGYCKSVQSTVMQYIKADGKIRFVYKDLPILSETSVLAAKAALASRAQGRYVEFNNALMGHRGAFNEDTVFRLAGSVGLDLDKLKADMGKPEIQTILDADKKLADALGIRGTPAFVVGDHLVPGAVPMEEIARLVAEQRKK